MSTKQILALSTLARLLLEVALEVNAFARPSTAKVAHKVFVKQVNRLLMDAVKAGASLRWSTVQACNLEHGVHARDTRGIRRVAIEAADAVQALIPSDRRHWTAEDARVESTVVPQEKAPAKGRPAEHRHPVTGLWMTRAEIEALEELKALGLTAVDLA